jgi:hypothetical protein
LNPFELGRKACRAYSDVVSEVDTVFEVDMNLRCRFSRRVMTMKYNNAIRKWVLCGGLVSFGLLASSGVSRAAVTTFLDLPSWLAAAGSPIAVEDFADSTLLPGFTITFGQNIPAGYIAGGTYNDVAVTQFNDAKNPKLLFAGGTFVFGADWDLGPGGAGDGLLLVLQFTDSTTTTLSIGNPLPNAFQGFFGFVSDVPVASIRLDSPGTGVESFAMDNARFRVGGSPFKFDDVADGTMINTRYSGVIFTNLIGGSIYARLSLSAPSPSNVVSVFGSGVPAFDARYGAVDAHLATPVKVVKIDARPVAPLEFLGTLSRRPFLQAFDSYNNLLGTVYYAGALPTGSGEIGPTETLTFVSTANNIAVARWSTQNPLTPPGYTPTYGLFDNFRAGPPNLAVSRSVGPSGTTVYLSWPADLGDWRLMSTTSLTPPVNWQPWPGSQSSHYGLISVSTTATDASRYFQLSE